MTYRDEVVVLEERHRMLQQALDAAHARSHIVSTETAAIHRDLAQSREALERAYAARRAGDARRRRLPLAKTLVASPCDVPWSAMTGDDRMRFCKSCEKHVHNLAAMTEEEVEAFLFANADHSACVRVYERADGTILTADCPVGVKRRRRRALVLAMLGPGACALFGFGAVALTLAVAKATQPPPPAPPAPRVVTVEVPGPVVERTQTITVETIPQGTRRLPEAPAEMGWVTVFAPEGTKVFEGKRLLGVGPLVITMKAGMHDLRAVGSDDEGTWSTETSIVVTHASGAEVHFERRHFVPIAGSMPVRRFDRDF
jgi:hypothetical protein